jgi:hypothetical protein
MARTRNTRTRNGVSRPVTARTAARRARKRTAEQVASGRRENTENEPETLGQARVWQRKCERYRIVGLCDVCCAQAAYGHACGFQKIKDPCLVCQPIVSNFPTPGPRGSKWRKLLLKVEYFDEEQLSELLDVLLD